METDKNSPEYLEQHFPSLELVYPLAVASYDTIIRRIDAVVTRVQTMTAFSLTTLLAVPILARAQDIEFNLLFFAAVLCMLFAITVSVFAQWTGEVRNLNVEALRDDFLHLDKPVFQNYIIYYAAESYKKNVAVLTKKWRLGVVSLVFFALSLSSLLAWVLTSPRP